MSDRTVKKECPECGKEGSWIMAVRSTQPTFGNDDTLWNMRERKRNGKDNFNGHI